MSEEIEAKINAFEKLYIGFNKDPKAAFIAVLIMVVMGLTYYIGTLHTSQLELKDEVIKEVRSGYDRELSAFKKELKDTVMSSKANMDTTLKNVNDYVKSK